MRWAARIGMVWLGGLVGCGQEGAPPPIADRSAGNGSAAGIDHHGPDVGEKKPAPAVLQVGPQKPSVQEGDAALAVALPPPPEALMTVPAAHEPAPETFTISWETTRGTFDMTCHREWSPHGADRLHYLVQKGYYTDTAFFRVVSGFMAQFGLHGHPEVNAVWLDASVPDDPVTHANTRGMVSFATSGPNTRSTQLFISFGDNSRLDGMGFSPLCQVDAAGMKVVDSLYSGYGEGAPRGAGPRQDFIHKRGNTYLKESFDKLDYIQRATIR